MITLQRTQLRHPDGSGYMLVEHEGSHQDWWISERFHLKLLGDTGNGEWFEIDESRHTTYDEMDAKVEAVLEHFEDEGYKGATPQRQPEHL